MCSNITRTYTKIYNVMRCNGYLPIYINTHLRKFISYINLPICTGRGVMISIKNMTFCYFIIYHYCVKECDVFTFKTLYRCIPITPYVSISQSCHCSSSKLSLSNAHSTNILNYLLSNKLLLYQSINHCCDSDLTNATQKNGTTSLY